MKIDDSCARSCLEIVREHLYHLSGLKLIFYPLKNEQQLLDTYLATRAPMLRFLGIIKQPHDTVRGFNTVPGLCTKLSANVVAHMGSPFRQLELQNIEFSDADDYGAFFRSLEHLRINNPCIDENERILLSQLPNLRTVDFECDCYSLAAERADMPNLSHLDWMKITCHAYSEPFTSSIYHSRVRCIHIRMVWTAWTILDYLPPRSNFGMHVQSVSFFEDEIQMVWISTEGIEQMSTWDLTANPSNHGQSHISKDQDSLLLMASKLEFDLTQWPTLEGMSFSNSQEVVIRLNSDPHDPKFPELMKKLKQIRCSHLKRLVLKSHCEATILTWRELVMLLETLLKFTLPKAPYIDELVIKGVVVISSGDAAEDRKAQDDIRIAAGRIEFA